MASENGILIGISPAGTEWRVYPRDGESSESVTLRVQQQQERLAALHSKRSRNEAATPELTPLQAAEKSYLAAKKAYLRSKGAVNAQSRIRTQTPDQRDRARADHELVSARLQTAKKAYDKAKREAAKAARQAAG